MTRPRKTQKNGCFFWVKGAGTGDGSNWVIMSSSDLHHILSVKSDLISCMKKHVYIYIYTLSTLRCFPSAYAHWIYIKLKRYVRYFTCLSSRSAKMATENKTLWMQRPKWDGVYFYFYCYQYKGRRQQDGGDKEQKTLICSCKTLQLDTYAKKKSDYNYSFSWPVDHSVLRRTMIRLYDLKTLLYSDPLSHSKYFKVVSRIWIATSKIKGQVANTKQHGRAECSQKS